MEANGKNSTKFSNKFILFAAVFMLMKSWIHEVQIVGARGCIEQSRCV